MFRHVATLKLELFKGVLASGLAGLSGLGGGGAYRSFTLDRNPSNMAASAGSTESQSDHLTRTASNTRHPNAVDVKIKKILRLTPTIKGFVLKVPSTTGLDFRAGQWVDFFVPGVDRVGGFSIWSGPGLLEDKSLLELAVKESEVQPAKWLHHEAQVGQEVAIRIGGDFHYPNQLVAKGPQKHNLLLVAGGIGINPLMSIMYHVLNLRGVGKIPETNRVKLLYSARSVEELALKDRIDKVCSGNDQQQSKPVFEASYFVTRDTNEAGQKDLHCRRIGIKDLEEAMGSLGSLDPVYCYLCGPSTMITEVAKDLEELGLPKERIFYELWW